jgi:hypothetical protein
VIEGLRLCLVTRAAHRVAFVFVAAFKLRIVLRATSIHPYRSDHNDSDYEKES